MTTKTAVVRDTSTPDNIEFWAFCERAAEQVKQWPDWRRAGINITTELQTKEADK